MTSQQIQAEVELLNRRLHEDLRPHIRAAAVKFRDLGNLWVGNSGGAVAADLDLLPDIEQLRSILTDSAAVNSRIDELKIELRRLQGY